MNILIPMAGFGSRMRPHSLSTPKPLLKIAGKPVIEHLVDSLFAMVHQTVENIVFIIGHFENDIKKQLLQIAEKHKVQGILVYQHEKLGLAHALICAEQYLKGPCLLAFSDTLFQISPSIKPLKGNYMWVKEIDDPSAYGVVCVNELNEVVAIVEKPQQPISNQALIGLYYFEAAEQLKDAIVWVIQENTMERGEYSFAAALNRMLAQKIVLQTATVDAWLDCGTPAAFLDANRQLLELKHQISLDIEQYNCRIIPPCYIAAGSKLENAVIGPYVSINGPCSISNSVICHSIIGSGAQIKNIVFHQSIIGKDGNILNNKKAVDISDFSSKMSS